MIPALLPLTIASTTEWTTPGGTTVCKITTEDGADHEAGSATPPSGEIKHVVSFDDAHAGWSRTDRRRAGSEHGRAVRSHPWLLGPDMREYMEGLIGQTLSTPVDEEPNWIRGFDGSRVRVATRGDVRVQGYAVIPAASLP
jgi:hypothetical protein